MYYDKACKHMLIRLLTEIIYCGLRSYNLAAPRYNNKIRFKPIKKYECPLLIIVLLQIRSIIKIEWICGYAVYKLYSFARPWISYVYFLAYMGLKINFEILITENMLNLYCFSIRRFFSVYHESVIRLENW